MCPIQQSAKTLHEWSNSSLTALLSFLNFEVVEPTFDWIITNYTTVDHSEFRYQVEEFLTSNALMHFDTSRPEVFQNSFKYLSHLPEVDRTELHRIQDEIWEILQFSPEEKIDDTHGKSNRKNGSNYREFFSLEQRHIVERPVHATDMKLFDQYGILPGRKYSIDVHYEIADRLACGTGPDQIAEDLRDEYPSLSLARISPNTVRSTAYILEFALSDNLIFHPLIQQPYAVQIDSTTAYSGGRSLLVSQAVSMTNSGDSDEETESIQYPNTDIHTIEGNNFDSIPLYAKYLSSVNKESMISVLSELRGKLLAYQSILDKLGLAEIEPQLPTAIIADFAKTILPVVNKVFPTGSIIKQGCHYHFEEIVAKVLIEPVYKELRKACYQLLSDLRYYAKKHRFRHKSSFFEQVMAEVINYYTQLRSYGRYGKNLIDLINKFNLLKRRIAQKIDDIENGRIPENSGHARFTRAMTRIFADHDFDGINSIIRSLNQRLHFFYSLQETLSRSFDTEEAARGALLSVADHWRFHADLLELPDLEAAASKIDKHVELLIPAMYIEELPRTTSSLEGVHGYVKKKIRIWSGLSQTPVSFETYASSLTLLIGYETDPTSDLSENPRGELKKLNLRFSISPSIWVKSSLKVTDKMRHRRKVLEASRAMKFAKGPKGFINAFDRIWEEALE